MRLRLMSLDPILSVGLVIVTLLLTITILITIAVAADIAAGATSRGTQIGDAIENHAEHLGAGAVH